VFIPEPYQTKHDVLDLVAKLIENFPLSTLISSKKEDIFISKVPIVLFEGKIYGHLSLRNDHCTYLKDKDCKHRLLIDGPQGFVSPRFLGNRAHDVPTWNYVSSVVDASVSCITDKKGIGQILTRQLRSYDGQGLSFLHSSEFDIIEKEVLGFSIPLTKQNVTIKQKLSQNKSDDDFNLIIESLRQRGEEKLVEWMVNARGAPGLRSFNFYSAEEQK
jgi:predicted FMN-binding regulatory protein PaiB